MVSVLFFDSEEQTVLPRVEPMLDMCHSTDASCLAHGIKVNFLSSLIYHDLCDISLDHGIVFLFISLDCFIHLHESQNHSQFYTINAFTLSTAIIRISCNSKVPRLGEPAIPHHHLLDPPLRQQSFIVDSDVTEQLVPRPIPRSHKFPTKRRNHEPTDPPLNDGEYFCVPHWPSRLRM